MGNRGRAWIIGIIVAVMVGIGIIGALWLRRGPGPSGGPHPGEAADVHFGLGVQESGALPIIAAERGLFREEGLRCQVRDYVSGKRALHGMLADEVDIANTAAVPAVMQSFEQSDFRVVAQVGTLTGMEKVVARKDRGISTPADLRGKVLGTQRGSAVHYFLHLFLLRHGMSEENAEMHYLKAESLPPALAEGQIAAYSMREPYVSRGVELLGEKAIVFGAPGIYYRTELLVVREGFLEENPGAVRGMIRALCRAETFAREHPEEAARLVARRLGVPAEDITGMWENFQLSVGLHQSLFNTLEAQARWAIQCELTDADAVPDYLDFVVTDPLRVVKPGAVGIIE